jgi:class 3 adenylate cyclase/Cdc6-like AAA superfamily ATPase
MAEERKLVTILFADVSGWTALGEALDPEDVRALASRYYQHARRVIAEHGGTLEKFIGDATMAVFGLPHVHGNDAERALAAAMALRAAVADDPFLSPHFALHVGVDTGEVATAYPAADPATADSLVTGDAVNTAARLYDAAEAGEILAGERTHAAAESAFLFEEPRFIAAKNKRRPVRAYPLLGPRPTRRMTRPSLVGRRRELAQLGLLRDTALEERHPQLVSIVAPAGTGKTRLLEEFLSKLKRTQAWQVATARCLPYGQSLTYWPLRSLLDELLGAPFSPKLVRAAYAAGGQTAEDAVRLAGLLLASLGIEVGVEARSEAGGEAGGEAAERQVERESTFTAWRLLVEALARQAPRIVVFEDLHWASDSLLDLVEHVTHPRTRAALLIAVLSRPELLDRRPSWGGGRRSFTALTLDALSAEQTRQLIDPIVDRLMPPDIASEAVRERIVERSGGNPFFAIELSRGLAERLAELPDDGAPTAGEGARTEALPDTVHEAVLARLDQLSESERAVLQVAAVAGRTFRPPTLRAALPARDAGVIGTALEGLLSRDIVAPVEGEAGTYTFRHILFRDVAYGTLARAERVRLHLAVAGWLEEFAGDRVDEFVELLAYHYREAVTLARQSAVPLEVEVDAGRAIHYLERAGELASHVGLLAAAIDHLRAAITLAPAEEHGRLFERLGDCAFAGEAAMEGYRRALALWREGSPSDPLTGARLLRKLLEVYWKFGGKFGAAESPEEVSALHAEALRLAEEAGDEDELWRVRIAPFNAFNHSDSRAELERDRELFRAAEAYFVQRADWPALYMALDGVAAYAIRLGAFEEALAAMRRSLHWPNLPWWARANALNMIVTAYAYQLDYDACLAAAREALTQVRPGDPIGLLAATMGSAAWAAYLSGRWTELEWLREAQTLMWEEAQQVPGLVRNLFWTGAMPMLAAALAREDRAAADAAAALLERTLNPAHPQTPGRRSILAAYLADDPTRLDQEALAQLPVLLWWDLVFLTERGLPAPVWLIQRARDEESVHFTLLAALADTVTSGDGARLAAAIDTAEARQWVPLAARVRIVLAQRTGDRTHLDRARPVLERLGDRQFLRRLEEVQAALQ